MCYRVQQRLIEELTAITKKDEVGPIIWIPRLNDGSNLKFPLVTLLSPRLHENRIVSQNRCVVPKET